jgi:polyphosphate glucokinase
MITALPHTAGTITPSEKPSRDSHCVGLDVGGTNIKSAIVDTSDGALITPLLHLPTPVPATPWAVAGALEKILEELSTATGAPHSVTNVGVALPAIVRDGVTRSAANIDPAWIGLDAQYFLADRLGRAVHLLNDADAAGLAEARYGAGRGKDGRPAPGTVLVITLGTGIGSALIVNGHLVPNTELGHLEIDGADAETQASALVREKQGLCWTTYADRLQRYFSHLEFLFSPDLFIVGGGISACHHDFLPRLRLQTPIVPAELRNTAGTIGSARHAHALTAAPEATVSTLKSQVC